MAELTQEQLDRLKRLGEYMPLVAVTHKDTLALHALLAAYEEQVRENERLKAELELEKTNGDAIMEIRASLHERFGAEVDAAFFDDVVANALTLAARPAEAMLAKLREALQRYGRHDGQITGARICDCLSLEWERAAGEKPCSCGLAAALAASPEPKE